jgi:hypothetical protein
LRFCIAQLLSSESKEMAYRDCKKEFGEHNTPRIKPNDILTMHVEGDEPNV